MDYKNLVQRCCDFYEKCVGIPYDFAGTLSLEAKFIKLFKVCQEMFAQNAELAKAFGDLSQKVDDFISDVGVQGMVERIIQEMADDGSLAEIIGDDLLAPVKQKLANHETRISELESEVGTLSGLPARMTAVEQKANQASTDAASAKEMAQQAKNAVDAIPPDIGSVGEQLTEFESRISAVETSNANTVKTVQSYDQRITAAASTAGNAQRDATTAKNAADEAKETADGLASDVAQAKSDASTAKTDATQAKSDASQAKSQSNTNAENIGELQTQVAQNTSDIAELKSGGGGGGGADPALEGRVSTLESEVSTLETNYSSLSQQVSGFSENINQAVSDASTAKSEASQAQSDVSALESTVTGIQSDVSENTSDISKNTSDITSLKSRVSALEEGGASTEDIHGWWSGKTWLFVGDSWMEGFNDDVSGSSGNLIKGWGAQAALQMGFLQSQLNTTGGFYVTASGGTGFAAQSNGFRTMLTEWCNEHTSILDKVDFVVVGGGYNDGYYSESQITTGINNFMQVVNTRLPNATCIIVPIAWANYGASNAYSNLYSTSQLGGMLDAYLNYLNGDSAGRGKSVVVCDTLWAIGRYAGIYDSRGMHPTYAGNALIGHCFAQWVKGASGFDYVTPKKNPETVKIEFVSTWSTSQIAMQSRISGDQLIVGVPYNGECILKCSAQEMYMYYDSEFKVGTVKSASVNGRTNGIYWVVPATAKSAGDDGGSFFDIHCMLSIRSGSLYCKPICMNDSRTDYLRLRNLTEIAFYCKLPFTSAELYSQ